MPRPHARFAEAAVVKDVEDEAAKMVGHLKPLSFSWITKDWLVLSCFPCLLWKVLELAATPSGALTAEGNMGLLRRDAKYR